MARGPEFFRQMTEQLLEQLEERARQPGVKLDEICAWLDSQGVQASRSAVGRWWQDFRLWDKAERSREVARTYLTAVSSQDQHTVAEASLRKFNELIFEALASGDELDAGELMKISVALKTGLGAQQLVVNLQRQRDAAVREGEAAARSGASGADVIETIKRALALTA